MALGVVRPPQIRHLTTSKCLGVFRLGWVAEPPQIPLWPDWSRGMVQPPNNQPFFNLLLRSRLKNMVQYPRSQSMKRIVFVGIFWWCLHKTALQDSWKTTLLLRVKEKLKAKELEEDDLTWNFFFSEVSVVLLFSFLMIAFYDVLVSSYPSFTMATDTKMYLNWVLIRVGMLKFVTWTWLCSSILAYFFYCWFSWLLCVLEKNENSKWRIQLNYLIKGRLSYIIILFHNQHLF